MANLSVVIPSVGDRPDWRAALASVAESGRESAVETEIILVWQGQGRPDVPPGVSVVPVHRVGVSYARNRGAEQATAPLLAYIDDDEIVDPEWAGQVVEALTDADAAFGPIGPIDEEGRPHCPTDNGAGRIVDPSTPPWLVGSGGNMAFRRDALSAVGGFDLRFGPGAIGESGEETDLIWRLLDARRPIRWAPEMIAYHPTKTDVEIGASRRPYGVGSGRMLRRSRSPRLIANYLHAVARANLTAIRKRDATARHEAREFGLGLVDGLTRRRTWVSPDLAGEDVPHEVREAIGDRNCKPLPVSWGTRPHYIWDFGDVVLHAYIGPSDAQLAAPAARERIMASPGVARIPPIHAHGRSRDALWVLEGHVAGELLSPAESEDWWPEAAAWVLAYSRPVGPAFESTEEWRVDAGFVDSAPEQLRAVLDDALARMAPRPTGPCHGDLQPKNLVKTPDGIAAVDWEWCTDAGLRGMDLIFLATTHAGLEPDHQVVEALLEGRNPPFADVLGPLADLGLEGSALRDALLVMLVKWASNERRSIAMFGAAPRRTLFGDLLQAMIPILV
jgi:hypothetical protein